MAGRNNAPGALSEWPGPKDTAVTILTLARALAIATLVGVNLAAWLGAGTGGPAIGEFAAARSNKGPIIGDMVTKMKRHGYPLVKHCSKMDRFMAVASVDALC